MQCADGVIAQTAIVALACFPCNGNTVKIPAVNYIMEANHLQLLLTIWKMGYDQVAIIQVLDTCCECILTITTHWSTFIVSRVVFWTMHIVIQYSIHQYNIIIVADISALLFHQEFAMYVCIIMEYYKLGDMDRVLKQKRRSKEHIEELVS